MVVDTLDYVTAIAGVRPTGLCECARVLQVVVTSRPPRWYLQDYKQVMSKDFVRRHFGLLVSLNREREGILTTDI